VREREKREIYVNKAKPLHAVIPPFLCPQGINFDHI